MKEMSIETSSGKAPVRHHDKLPTVAARMTFPNLIRGFLQTPFGRQFPLPTIGILDDVQTATIVGKDGEIKVQVHESEGDLSPGQRVILFKQGRPE